MNLGQVCKIPKKDEKKFWNKLYKRFNEIDTMVEQAEQEVEKNLCPTCAKKETCEEVSIGDGYYVETCVNYEKQL